MNVVRLIIVLLIVLGLIGSVLLGTVTTAYGMERTLSAERGRANALRGNFSLALSSRALPLALSSRASERYLVNAATEWRTSLLPASTRIFADLLPGDRIDGHPAEDYLTSTSDVPEVAAPYAGLCTKDGTLLFERNVDSAVSMASTTKMMTALVALENMSADHLLKVTSVAASTEGTSAGLQEDIELTLLDALYALLLPSGNDAAVVIAQNISNTEARFVELMNAKAAELGLTSTHFADSSGLSDENHYTTVRDFLLLARVCMDNRTFRDIVGSQTYTTTVGGEEREFVSTSMLPDVLEGAEALGIKTGSTDAAGFCFVGAAVARGIELYTVVFAAPSSEQRFYDTAELLEWGFRHYRAVELINTSQQVAEVALLSWPDKTVAAYAPAAVRIELFDLNGPISQEINITDIEGEASRGKTCGEIVWTQRDEVLATSSVVVGTTVLAPDFWQGLTIAWQRFWGTFFGELTHAESRLLLKQELTVPEPSAA
ncbi:MAG: hypothetical protein LBU07_01840 [Coriobacteriales bacterium]|nr:hypothetical protein [Coriobacteriales bacterium]